MDHYNSMRERNEPRNDEIVFLPVPDNEKRNAQSHRRPNDVFLPDLGNDESVLLNLNLTLNSFENPLVTMRPVNTGIKKIRSRSVRNRVSKFMTPLFPWATNIRGRIHTLEYITAHQITTITGEVHCNHCRETYWVSYNLRERFAKVAMYLTAEKSIMRARAPDLWSNPKLSRCELCGHDDTVKPVIHRRKRYINWLFLLLGQTLGFCTLEQLKNFCKNSSNHCTAAKDRLLYSSYLGLCKMLQPENKLFDL